MTFNVRASGVNPNIGLTPEAAPFIYKKYLILCLSFEKSGNIINIP